jgi:hypothetical protein
MRRFVTRALDFEVVGIVFSSVLGRRLVLPLGRRMLFLVGTRTRVLSFAPMQPLAHLAE